MWTVFFVYLDTFLLDIRLLLMCLKCSSGRQEYRDLFGYNQSISPLGQYLLKLPKVEEYRIIWNSSRKKELKNLLADYCKYVWKQQIQKSVLYSCSVELYWYNLLTCSFTFVIRLILQNAIVERVSNSKYIISCTCAVNIVWRTNTQI